MWYETGRADTATSSWPTCWDRRGGNGAYTRSWPPSDPPRYDSGKSHNSHQPSYSRFPTKSDSGWPARIPSKITIGMSPRDPHWGCNRGANSGYSPPRGYRAAVRDVAWGPTTAPSEPASTSIPLQRERDISSTRRMTMKYWPLPAWTAYARTRAVWLGRCRWRRGGRARLRGSAVGRGRSWRRERRLQRRSAPHSPKPTSSRGFIIASNINYHYHVIASILAGKGRASLGTTSHRCSLKRGNTYFSTALLDFPLGIPYVRPFFPFGLSMSYSAWY